MPRPYNQKTVKDALLLLDIYASNGCSFEEAASGAEVRPSSTGYRVAEHLVDKLADMFPEERLAVIAGEAAGLLREGWRIGDEIPMRGPSATLENVDAILGEQYGAGNVEAMANAPNPFDLSSIDRTIAAPTEHGAFGPIVWNGSPPEASALAEPLAKLDPIPPSEPGTMKFRLAEVETPVLADPLDAVEEPSDEEIAHAFDDDPDPVTTEIVDNSADYEYDSTEPTE